MKHEWMSFCAAAALTVWTTVAWAQEPAVPPVKQEPAKAEPAKAVPAEWQGLILVPATNAAPDVLAMLSTRGKGRKVKVYALVLSPKADITVAGEIKDLVIKGSTVKIKGELDGDGVTILVKTATEIVPNNDPDHKKSYEKTVRRRQ